MAWRSTTTESTLRPDHHTVVTPALGVAVEHHYVTGGTVASWKRYASGPKYLPGFRKDVDALARGVT